MSQSKLGRSPIAGKQLIALDSREARKDWTEETMIKGKKQQEEEERKPSSEEKKPLKIGGLWVDPTRFPSLDEDNDNSKP